MSTTDLLFDDTPVGPSANAYPWSVYVVTDTAQCASRGRSVAQTVALAVEGGVTAVQVRCKDEPVRDFLRTLHEVAAVVPDDVPVLVNDRVDVFLAAHAAGLRVSGVHVGQRDMPVEVVRELVGQDVIIGLSARTPEQLRAAEMSVAHVDYVGVGPVFSTTTKRNAARVLGVEKFASLVGSLTIPAVAIGGVTYQDVGELRVHGASGVAVASQVCGAVDPVAAARELKLAWESSQHEPFRVHGVGVGERDS